MIKKIIKKIIGNSNILYLKSIYYYPKEIELVKKRKEFYSSFLKKDDLFFDVGANIGNRIIPLLKLGVRVVAIEPQEDCYKFLEMRFGKKIKIVKKGLGDKKEFKEFFISDLHTLSSFSEDWIESMSNSGRFSRDNWKGKKLISITTLNDLIQEFGIPKFIKIDVEGYELEVLKGLSIPIDYISFEYAVPEQFIRAIECIQQVSNTNRAIECNYSVGESLILSLDTWVTPNKMIELIKTDEFKNTRFGDVYIRRISVT